MSTGGAEGVTGQRRVQIEEAGIHAVGPGARSSAGCTPSCHQQGAPRTASPPSPGPSGHPPARPRPARTPPGPLDTVSTQHAAAGPRCSAPISH